MFLHTAASDQKLDGGKVWNKVTEEVALCKGRDCQMKADTICISKCMTKKGIAESLDAYINRAKQLHVRWAYFQEKYHTSYSGTAFKDTCIKGYLIILVDWKLCTLDSIMRDNN